VGIADLRTGVPVAEHGVTVPALRQRRRDRCRGTRLRVPMASATGNRV